MALGCQLDSGFGNVVFTLTYFSCDTFFARIGDDVVMPRDYQLGGSPGGTAFTVTSFSGENYYA